MLPNDYDIVSVTTYITDNSILVSAVFVPMNFLNNNRVVLSLINQYNAKISCTVSIIVGFKSK